MEDELIKIWQSSPEVEQIKFEKSRLMLDMQSSLDRFYRLLKYGILIEQIAIIIIIPVFLFYIYLVPPILAKIASFFIVIWAVWYWLRLRKWKRAKPTETATNYLDYLKKNKDYLEYSKRMSDTALYWYILPPMSGYFLFVAGHYLDGIINTDFLIKLIVLGVAVSIGSLIWIRFAVKKHYVPRLKKIDELIKAMEE